MTDIFNLVHSEVMAKIERPDVDNLDAFKALSPKKIQALAKGYEDELSHVRLEFKRLLYALEQIQVIRRGLSTAAFEESLAIGITCNNAIQNSDIRLRRD